MKISALPITDAGRIVASTIVDYEARFTVVLSTQPGDKLYWAVSPYDGETHLSGIPCPAPNQAEERRCAFPSDIVIAGLGLVLERGGNFFRLAEEPGKSDLSRLLVRNENQINDRLRWKDRIVDLNTRYFVARNSMRLGGDDFGFAARCMVSIGYEAIEHVHAAKIRWSESVCRDLLKRLDDAPDLNVCASVIIFWLHMCIFRNNAEDFAESISLTHEYLIDEGSDAIAAYNLLHILILQGGYLAGRQDWDAMIPLLDTADSFFVAAANHYPRALVNFGELAKIAHRNFIAQCALYLAREGRQPDIAIAPSFTPELAWDMGHRVRHKEAQERLRKSYLSMCRTT